jgi:crotonobetainyl-CoA:carnitine CoA-transferase CaiB-like acyl-CoA transferase
MQRPPSPEDDLSTPTAEPRNQRRLPLDGIRILDLTSVVVGPACTARLAQFGANIIKVESPEGDLMRTLGGESPTGQHSGAYLHLNRGKRNICIDLKNAAATDVIDRLLAWADVVITNMRPGALKRLGLDAASARATRPLLVHCLISGYGTDGPYAGEPAYDSVLQGVSGIAGLLGARSGTAEYVPLLLCDHVTGEIAAGAVMAAIIERHTTGLGSSLEVPMFETMAAFVLQEHLARQSFDPPLGPPGDPRLLTPHNRPVETADGAVSVTVNTDAQVRAFLALTERTEVLSDPRFQDPGARGRHQVEWLAIRSAPLRERTTAAWLDAFKAADIPAQPCHSLESLLDDPHLREVGLIDFDHHPTEGPVAAIRSTISIDGVYASAPQVASPRGWDALAVLAEIGFSESETSDLISRGAVPATPGPRANAPSSAS